MWDFVPKDKAKRVLTGREIAELTYSKYQKYHDVSVKADNFGGRQIAFNIYGPSLGTSSFKYTEKQYLQKLDRIASMLNDWDQSWYIREFLEGPFVPRRGLPSRPRADTAVTMRINTSPTWESV